MTTEKNPMDFLKYEKYLFYIAVFLHLIPLFSVTYFVTVDGPAHLYNANLVKNYLTGASSVIGQYFYFNSNPEPNWTGHFLFAVLLNFLPAVITEKLVLGLYVILLPVTFRLMVLKLNPGAGLLSFLVFPFIYNLPFSFGFFNFSLGLPVMFFGIYYFIKTGKFSWKESALFFFLALLAYFSHLFSCLLLLAVTGVYLLNLIIAEKGSLVQKCAKYKSKIILLSATALPVFLMILFFLKEKGLTGYKGKITRLPMEDLFFYVFSTRTLICWIYDKELEISMFMSLLLLGMIVLIIYSRIKKQNDMQFRNHEFLLLISLVMLILFFVVPDSAASGGFISIRVLLFFHLFLSAWIAVQQVKPLFGFVAAISALFISFNLMSVHVNISDGLDKDAKEMVSVIPSIKENSNLLPLNYGDNWLHLNLSNYIGTEKNIIVLDNYEPNYPQFPLKWQPMAYPYSLIGNFGSSKRPCIAIDNYEKVSGLKINYIMRWQYSNSYNDSCTLITNKLIQDYFEPVFTSPGKMAELFRRKLN